MRDKLSNVLWGIVLVAAGALVALCAFDVIDFDLGYLLSHFWPLFIIVPCFISFVKTPSAESCIGVFIGTIFLLNNFDVFSWNILKKLFIPGILIIIGLGLILKNAIYRSRYERTKRMDQNAPSYEVSFGSETFHVAEVPFRSCKADAAFGNLLLDLRGSYLEKEECVKASAVFGHVTILVPQGVNVKVSPSSTFGSVTNKTQKFEENAPVLYVDANSIFGGVSIE